MGALALAVAAQIAGFAAIVALPAPVLGLREPGGDAADQHPDHDREEDHGKQRQRPAELRSARRERIEGERHRAAVGDREQHHDDRDRQEEEGLEELSHGSTARGYFARAFGVASLRRMRISLPVLNTGITFSDTDTVSPVRGLRPLIENAPKPRSSTRSPRASASAMVSRIALTMFSTSR